MSGLEVIGGISAVVGILQGCVEACKEANKVLKLPETFRTVGRRLPFLLNALKGCENHLKASKDPLPPDVSEALKGVLDSCKAKATTLDKIYKEITPGDNKTRLERYKAFLKRVDKGSKVEELLAAITEDVRVVCDHDAVNYASASLSMELRDTVREAKELEPSDKDDNDSGGTTINVGRDQHNYNSSDNSHQQIYHGAVTYNGKN